MEKLDLIIEDIREIKSDVRLLSNKLDKKYEPIITKISKHETSLKWVKTLIIILVSSTIGLAFKTFL